MPSRNRAKEVARHGRLMGDLRGFNPQEHKLAEVTDQDLENFGRLATWASGYVNYIYEHAGFGDTPKSKRLSESLDWILWNPNREVLFEAVTIQRSDLDFHLNEEYERQARLGVQLDISERVELSEDWRGASESLHLVLDADGIVVKGDYDWVSPRNDLRPAPNASFTDTASAHLVTVSGRAANLLGKFRDLVIDPVSGLEMRNVWNRDLGYVPPVELQSY